MASSSTSMPLRRQGEPENAFDGIVAQASSSSSTLMKKGPCDVFINHRGCDTKHKLASTIYHTLDLLGLRAFLDVEELELGDCIPQQIQEVMRTAGLHIAIFSERYAESPWCLAELSFMLKTGTTILPVFYHVDPTDLRWVEKGLYAPAFSHHKEKLRYSSSMVEEWKNALQKASYLSGYMLNTHNDDEGKLLKSIVNSVLGTMKKVPLEVAKYPVAMDEIVKDFERSRGKSMQGERIVGIAGFGGSGKTTLATELYNRKSPSFSRSSFVHDVRDAASKNDLHTKQSKLLQDLRIQTASFDNLREGKAIVADRLKSLIVLIVLDDVDHEDQLDALLPPKDSFVSGSLVIVTTREGDVLTKCGITSIYRMQPLQNDHARQLFCWHAFLQPFPQEGFEDLVESFLNVCNGLPLSLKVTGGQLYGKRSRDHWVSQLDKIQRILPKEILQRLKVSYDALDEEEKEIFLDVACFFIGKRRSSAIAVWDGSGWSGQCSWETLHNKCLVEVDEEECIRMHDHLRDLGREIAVTHSPSRIWSEGQSMNIQQGMPIRGIMTAAGRMPQSPGRPLLEPLEEYMKMMRISNVRDGLQLLLLGKDDSPREFGELSRGLLWLRSESKYEYTPSSFSLENIRVLEIMDSKHLKAPWEDAHPPLQLRELLIQNAEELKSLPRSIGQLKHLKRLSLYCSNFSQSRRWSLPEEFCQLHSLEHLVLRGFVELSSLPNRFGDLVNLRHIDFMDCHSLKMLPVSFRKLINLEYLCLSSCSNLTLESGILENITYLKVFDVSYVPNLETLPHNITNQASLIKLLLRKNNSLRELPASIGQLSKLEELQIEDLPLLTRLPISLGNLSRLVTLRLVRCPELCEMPSFAGLVSLKHLNVQNCDKIKKIEGLEHLTSLENLYLWTCWMEPGIHGLWGVENPQRLNLRADNISSFEACIESIEMEKWPWEITICGKIFPGVRSILDSFTFPGLFMVNLVKVKNSFTWSLTCQETNLSYAAIVCYLVHCHSFTSGGDIWILEKESTFVTLSNGAWIVINFLREASPLIKDGGRCLQASIGSIFCQLYGGWLIVGERRSVIEGFKQLFQTLCKATSMN